MNITNLLSGATLSKKTSSVKPLVQMENGLAVIKSVTKYISKSGSICARIDFQDSANPNDESKGHAEYLSTGEATRFLSAARRLAYLEQHSDNQAAKDAFLTLGEPIEFPLGEDGQAIVYETKEEYDVLRAKYGDAIDFLWLSDVDDNTVNTSKKRVLCKFTDKEAYIEAYIGVMQSFVGGEYYLSFKKATRRDRVTKDVITLDFNRLTGIKSANV